jgi:hypothetical protein
MSPATTDQAGRQIPYPETPYPRSSSDLRLAGMMPVVRRSRRTC